MPKSKKRKKPQGGGGGRSPAPASAALALAQSAANWPVYECLATRDWQNTDDLVQVVVARRSALNGEVAAAVFLVDLGCLGIKNAMVTRFPSTRDYRDVIEGHLMLVQAFKPVSLDLAAKIVAEGLAYANTLGFLPHRDYFEAQPLLRGAEPDNAPEEVPHGRNGKPFYISGPDDNPTKIVRQLERAVGAGNFDYTVVLPPGVLPPPGIDPEHVETDGLNDGEIESERLGWLPPDVIEALDDEDLTPEQARTVLAPHWAAAVAREFVSQAPPDVLEALQNVAADHLARRLRPLLPDELRALFDSMVNATPDSLEEYLELLDSIDTSEEVALPPEIQALLQSDDPRAAAALDAFIFGQLLDSLDETLPKKTLDRIREQPLEQAIPALLAAVSPELRAILAPQLNLALERIKELHGTSR